MQLADVFDLLGDPSRLAILITLLGGARSVGDLANSAGLSDSATSHALRLLRAHRVVSARKEGRMAFYAIADDHVRELLELGLEHVHHTELLHSTPDGELHR
ncbi:ArsR/SmtB family transcription factor [Naasia lichenicola]|nr:metalloregulator ArsR/SmtB family transcription factor [Naasia lichenicola]